MKTIRLFSGLMLILNGVLHLVEYADLSYEPGSAGILVFGLLYIFTGVLLFIKKMFPVYLGLIIPLIGMSLSVIKFGIPELFSLSALFKLLGLIVVICCVILIIKHNNAKSLVR